MNKFLQTIISRTVLIGLVLCMNAEIAFSRGIQLDVDVGNPFLKAGTEQSTYLKIKLLGNDDENNYRSPVNIAVVIDKSGSMSGQKIAKAKEAAIMAISTLHENDIISVILYDSTVTVLVPATKVSDRGAIFSAINSISTGNNTALFAGVSKGAAELRKFLNDNRVNRMILLSDGLANVGPSSANELGKLGTSLIKEGISVTTIGLGINYNEDLMTQLALHSDGNHYFVEEAANLAQVFQQDFGQAMNVIAQEIKIEIICPVGVRPIRVLGRDAIITGQRTIVFMNQLYSQREKYIVLEIAVPEGRENQVRHIADVRVSFDDLTSRRQKQLQKTASITYALSDKWINEQINDDVMVDVVELIAIAKNEVAMRLRDKGKIQEARTAFIENQLYLENNADRYQSTKLKNYATDNLNDAQNLEPGQWERQRKKLREEQFQRRTQQETEIDTTNNENNK